MVNPKELLEDFLALGYTYADAVKHAHTVFYQRKTAEIENRRRQKIAASERLRTDGNRFTLLPS